MGAIDRFTNSRKGAGLDQTNITTNNSDGRIHWTQLSFSWAFENLPNFLFGVLEETQHLGEETFGCWAMAFNILDWIFNKIFSWSRAAFSHYFSIVLRIGRNLSPTARLLTEDVESNSFEVLNRIVFRVIVCLGFVKKKGEPRSFNNPRDNILSLLCDGIFSEYTLKWKHSIPNPLWVLNWIFRIFISGYPILAFGFSFESLGFGKICSRVLCRKNCMPSPFWILNKICSRWLFALAFT